MTRKKGVIAVLFLFVVAFIFAAISLSMQTGQMVERRIVTDQAADSAAYAFASKSAQGLNFIAVNNLAVAASVHMAGVVQIAADWGIIIKVLFKAKSMLKGGRIDMPESDQNDYDSVYELLRPIAKLYLRAATGMTRLSAVVKATFPYLGMVEAINTGAANIPGSIFLPFGVPLSPQTPPTAEPDSENFMQKMLKSLKSSISNLLPSYKGLSRINSDETFCLAFKAGESMGDDQHKLEDWLTGESTEPIPLLGTVLNGIMTVIGKFGVIGSFVGLQVGFSGCGFGATGEIHGGSGANNKAMIASQLVEILRGPVSGRSAKIQIGNDQFATLNPSKSADVLEQELNAKFRDDCQPQKSGPWRITQQFGGPKLEAAADPHTGLCLWPKDHLKKYTRNGMFQNGVELKPGETPTADTMFLRDYDVICHGTILFKWEAYSGLAGYIENGDVEHPKYYPAPGPKDGIGPTNQDLDLCDPFVANQLPHQSNGTVPYHYPLQPERLTLSHPENPILNSSSNYRSFVNLSRGHSFLAPILEGLVLKKFGEAPAKWEGADPPKTAFEELITMRNCAAGVHELCPFQSAEGPYFANVNGDRFYPKLDTFNWLCPASGNDATADNIRKTMKFKDPNDNRRWDHAEVNTGGESATTQNWVNNNRYKDIQHWHNARIDQLVNNMHCEEYVRYKSAKPAKNTTNAPHSTGTSHDYCDPQAHMCWQAALQNRMGDDLKKGNLSFFLPNKLPDSPASLDSSLHYAVLTLNPLRVDNGKDILVGDPSLPHCPKNMAVDAILEDQTTVKVCDIQPVIGFISRAITGSDGQKTALSAGESFGAGDANLASGGGISTEEQHRIGTSGFLAIAQSGVQYEKDQNGDPYRPGVPTESPPINVSLQTYRMFWPSWKPVLEPSRVLSAILPASITPLVED